MCAECIIQESSQRLSKKCWTFMVIVKGGPQPVRPTSLQWVLEARGTVSYSTREPRGVSRETGKQEG